MAVTRKMPRADEIWENSDLSGLTKLVTVAAASAYASGVIAINTYLHGLGIVDFSFAKPKLLLTGITVLFTYFNPGLSVVLSRMVGCCEPWQ